MNEFICKKLRGFFQNHLLVNALFHSLKCRKTSFCMGMLVTQPRGISADQIAALA